MTLFAATVLVSVAVSPAAARNARGRLLTMLNRARQSQGLRQVKLNLRLSDTARSHTRRMIQRDQLFDVPNLAQALAPYDWSWGGSVEGCGSTLHRVHRALMHHAAHRAIMLSPRARRVGIGVIRADGKTSCGRNSFWVTEILYG